MVYDIPILIYGLCVPYQKQLQYTMTNWITPKIVFKVHFLIFIVYPSSHCYEIIDKTGNFTFQKGGIAKNDIKIIDPGSIILEKNWKMDLGFWCAA